MSYCMPMFLQHCLSWLSYFKGKDESNGSTFLSVTNTNQTQDGNNDSLMINCNYDIMISLQLFEYISF